MSKPIAPNSSYQALFHELVQCIEQLDKGNLPIHQAITQYQHSLELKQECAARLEQSEFVLSIPSHTQQESFGAPTIQSNHTSNNIEDCLLELEAILDSMQHDSSLENNMLRFQQGAQLSQRLSQILQDQERELTIVQHTEDAFVPNLVRDTDVLSYDLFDLIEQ